MAGGGEEERGRTGGEIGVSVAVLNNLINEPLGNPEAPEDTQLLDPTH